MEYSTPRFSGPLAHNLLRLYDGHGRVCLENEYGTGPSSVGFNRVIRQRIGEGEVQFEYERAYDNFSETYDDREKPAIQVNGTERNGQAIHYVYNRFGNLLLREEMVLTRTGIILAQWRYRYNGDGLLIAWLTPQGRMGQALFGRDD